MSDFDNRGMRDLDDYLTGGGEPGGAEPHGHTYVRCEFPTCVQCGHCTEDGGRLVAGEALCGDCAEGAHYKALDGAAAEGWGTWA
jgi:hypothetical protein